MYAVYPTLGYWRKMDCWRWSAHVRPESSSVIVTIGSYDTITDCASRGIEVVCERSGVWEVYAKPKKEMGNNEDTVSRAEHDAAHCKP